MLVFFLTYEQFRFCFTKLFACFVRLVSADIQRHFSVGFGAVAAIEHGFDEFFVRLDFHGFFLSRAEADRRDGAEAAFRTLFSKYAESKLPEGL